MFDNVQSWAGIVKGAQLGFIRSVKTSQAPLARSRQDGLEQQALFALTSVQLNLAHMFSYPNTGPRFSS